MTATSRAPATLADRAGPIFALALLAIVALVLYRPWEPQPIAISDYGEYAPLLRQSSSLLERFAAVTRYYREEHGRANLVVYALLALKWTWLGDSGPAWLWTRFATMLLLGSLVFVLLRRLGCGRLGGAAGASLFLCAGTASQAWYLVNMGEPFGVLLLVAAAVLAAGYATAARWVWRAVAIAALCTAALLTKEMLALLLPTIVVLAACHRSGGRFEKPRLDRRTVTLVALLLSLTLAVAILVLVSAADASRQAYVTPYSLAYASWYKFVRLLCAVVFPVWPTDPADTRIALVGHLMFAAALWSGLRGDFYRPEARRDALVRLAVGALPVLVGLLLYLPWPNFAAFYGLPMLLGPAMLVGWALTPSHTAPAWVHRFAAGSVAGALLLAAPLAHRNARRSVAEARVYVRLAAELSRDVRGRPILYLTHVVRPGMWDTRGQNVSRFAATQGHRLTIGVEASCDSPVRTDSDDLVVVSFSTDCGILLGPTRVIREPYTFLDVGSMSVRRADITAVAAGL